MQTTMSADETGTARDAGCGCTVQESRDAGTHGLEPDPVAKDRNVKRLRRIEGQVRGLQRMVHEDRYCADVMTQISSAHEALRAVGRELMRNHLRHCTAAAQTANGNGEAMYDDLIEMFYKLRR